MMVVGWDPGGRTVGVNAMRLAPTNQIDGHSRMRLVNGTHPARSQLKDVVGVWDNA